MRETTKYILDIGLLKTRGICQDQGVDSKTDYVVQEDICRGEVTRYLEVRDERDLT